MPTMAMLFTVLRMPRMKVIGIIVVVHVSQRAVRAIGRNRAETEEACSKR